MKCIRNDCPRYHTFGDFEICGDKMLESKECKDWEKVIQDLDLNISEVERQLATLKAMKESFYELL